MSYCVLFMGGFFMKSKLFGLVAAALVVGHLQAAETSDEQKLLLAVMRKFPELRFSGRDFVKVLQVKGGDQKDCVSNCDRWFSAPNNQLYMVVKRGGLLELHTIGKDVTALDCGKKVQELNPTQFTAETYQAGSKTVCQMYTIDDRGQLTIEEGQRPLKLAYGVRHVPGARITLDLCREADQKMFLEACHIVTDERLAAQQK